MRLRLLIVLALILAWLIVLSSCSSQTATTSSSTAGTSSPTGATNGSSFGQMATAGASIFASKCAMCHGDNGQGVTAPAVIGTGANLGKYDTAQGLLNFISTAMPANAPGSLSQQEYWNVLSHLLVKNNKVSSNTAFKENDLGNISLK